MADKTNPSQTLYVNPEPLRVANPEGSVPTKPTLPEAFPVVSDFRVEPLPDMSGHFGVQMRWVSDSLGVVAEFPWWDHLERERELLSYVPDGLPIGSREEPFVDVAMNWGIRMVRPDANPIPVLAGFPPVFAAGVWAVAAIVWVWFLHGIVAAVRR
jgi:hypothetical protein